MPFTGLRALIIEDDPGVRRFLQATFAVQGFTIQEADAGRAGIEIAATQKFDIVVLDLALPDVDGQELIPRLRTLTAAPIMVLSSRDDEAEKVKALDAGANDYVTKPFGVDELMARVRVSMRDRLTVNDANPIFRTGELEINVNSRIVRRGTEDIRLAPKEFALLRQLVLNAGKVMTTKHLMEAAWGEEADIQYLRIYIRQIRQKLELNPARPRLIVNEPGIGYRLQVDGMMPKAS